MTPLAARTFDVVALGEALVDLLPSQPGPLAEVPSFSRHAGGSPANVAIGVARLGGRSAFVGTVGDDPFGAFLRQALTAEGVDTRALVAQRGGKTGVAFVSLDAKGSPSFFSPGGGRADLMLSAAETALAPTEDARFLHMGTLILSGEPSGPAAMATLHRARSAGTLIAIDLNLRIHLWRSPEALADAVRKVVPLADVIKLSSDECSFVTGFGEPLTAARILLDRGPRLVVVTCGPAGCVWARRTGASVESGTIPARRAAVVDTTGAGDGFLALLLTGLARRYRAGEDGLSMDSDRLTRLLALAGEAGTRVCERVGAVAGLPTAKEMGSLDV
jgi:fructokinase